MYQIIPRKYRPQSFKKIVGQDSIVATLKNSILQKRLAQAYLFCGGKGTGKTTLARLFAKALNCSHLSEDQEPCNSCPSCIEITSGRSLDVLEIDGASNRGIDDIRQINDTVAYAPSSGKYKIYIIDEVHMLTKEAFNALLKTLEEPPPHVKFFFATTESHKVLPTIISRCQRFELNRITKEAMEEKIKFIANDLETIIEPEALDMLIELSEGSLRDGESLLDQLISFSQGIITKETLSSAFGITSKEIYEKLDEAILSHHLSFAYTLAEDIFSSGKDLSAFMDGLVKHFRSHLKAAAITSNVKSVFTTDHCLYIIEYLIEWGYKLAKTPFKQAGLEIILLHLIRSSQRVSVDVLVHRLLELENKFDVQPENISILQEEQVEKKPSVALPPVTEKKIEPTFSSLAIPEQPSNKSRYDTLIRFAAVELEGISEK